jgi:glycosyltransferase involved in cell wall biosynthesis
MGALISCIVPVFNGERFLQEALDSILAQTYAPLEVVVVDDGSTDGTAAVLAKYDESVRVFRKANAGPAAARNTGIAAARGEFIAFLDSDDIWHAEKLARQMSRFEVRPDLSACITHIQNFFMPELSEEEKQLRRHPRSQPIAGYSSVTLLARRTLFDAVGLFDETLKHGDDTDWFLRARAAGAAIDVLPEVLVSRRLHAHNRSRQWAGRSQLEYLKLLKTFVDSQRRSASDLKPA